MLTSSIEATGVTVVGPPLGVAAAAVGTGESLDAVALALPEIVGAAVPLTVALGVPLGDGDTVPLTVGLGVPVTDGEGEALVVAPGELVVAGDGELVTGETAALGEPEPTGVALEDPP